MALKIKRLSYSLLNPSGLMKTPGMALRTVISKSGLGVYASSDILFKGAVFGRDSLEVAEDLINIRPSLVKRIIFTLTALQGSANNNVSEEEPGRIIHEYRTTVVDGKPIDESSMRIFKALSSKWGGTETKMAYYGSVDATPLYIRTTGEFCRLYGRDILHTKLAHKDGGMITVSEALEKSCRWVVNKLESSSSGFIEYKRMNPDGIQNQVWKDSNEFYVHENGELANHDEPIASIEVQAIAYDALLHAAYIFPNNKKYYLNTAVKLKENIFETLWIAEKNYFALGVDYAHGTMRRINTLAANQGALLDSKLFDDLDEDLKMHYISGIVNTLFSTEFLSDAGIRSRALGTSQLVDFWDYHGSFVSWIKETYDIAKGLKRQGFPALSRQLENRLLNVCLRYKAYPEFVYVDRAGRVLASAPKDKFKGAIMTIDATNQPERVQAWTVSAIDAIVTSRLKNKLKKQIYTQEDWQRKLEETILLSIPNVNRYLNPMALSAKYPAYPYKVERSV